MKNFLQISLPMTSAATCMPAARWRAISATTTSGAEFRPGGAERIAPATNGSGVWAHEAKSVSRTQKQALISRSTATAIQLDGYGFATPVDVTDERGGVPTGIPPRSRPA